MKMEGHYKNPIVLQRADPWVYKHTDGYYYFTGSVPGYQEIEVRRAKSLNELATAERHNVWHAHETGPLSRLIWAPEIHFIRGILQPVMTKKFVMSVITIVCSS